MARTIRRKSKLVTCYRMGYLRHQAETDPKGYRKALALFHSDAGDVFLGGVPRWYRLQTGAHRNRMRERQKLVRGIQCDEWDDHLPDARCRGMSWYW